jgi:hypothetical protein
VAASTFLPDITVEVGFGYGYGTPLASIVWTDVSTYVEAQSLINIFRGRGDETSDVTPSTLSVTFDNKDGRFTPEYTSGAYYPNVKLGTPIRVSAVWTLPAGTTYRRFTGYVNDWGIGWPDRTSAMSTVTVTATSRMARMGRSAEMRSVIEEEVLADGPVMYYPLSDPAGSLQASSEAPSYQDPLAIVQAGSGGTLTFGAAVGPETDGLTAATFTRSAVAAGKYLQATPSATVVSNADDHFALECWFNTTEEPVTLASLGSPDNYVVLYVSAGKLVAFGALAGVSGGSVFSTTNVDDGLTHHAVLKWDYVGATYTSTLMLDGAVVNTNTAAVDYFTAWGTGDLYVGADPSSPTIMDGTLAHVAVYGTGPEVTTADFAAHYAAGTVGFAGESSDQAIVRLAAYAGVPSAEVGTEAGNTTSMSNIDTTGKAPVEAMLDVVRTENGLLFDAGDGTLTFQSRGHRYGATSAITLNASTQQIEGDLQPKLDDQGLTNDVTATQPNGITVRVVNQSSVDSYGVYRDSVEVLTTSDLEVASFAELLTTTYAEPLVRVPNASVNLIVQPSATVTSLLALELGDLVTFTNLPAQAPASTMTFFIEGIQESFGMAPGETWVMTFNLSPGDIPGDVWILGTSQLGTDTVLAY